MIIYDRIKDGSMPSPECAKTLGFDLIDYSADNLEIHVAFVGADSFTNPAGNIQGGFLCAMLDDVMGPALVFSLPDNQFAPTLELKTQFLKPAYPGRIEGKGRVVRRGKDICFLEGELFQNSSLIARATATAIIRTLNANKRIHETSS